MNQVHEGHPGGFPIYRNKRGWPRWYQRYVEAWLILTGSWSLHRAWQRGHEHGTAHEYHRIVVNGGDTLPIRMLEREQCAAIAENPGFIEGRDSEWDEGVNFAKGFIAAAIRKALPGPSAHYTIY